MAKAVRFRTFTAADAAETHHAGGACDGVHRHDTAYAAIVLDGAYDEASADGAANVAGGDIVLHPPFHAHRNTFGKQGAIVLNIALPAARAAALGYRVIRTAAVQEIATLARHNVCTAAKAVIEEAAAVRPAPSRKDWIEAAAAQLRDEPAFEVGDVARAAGRSPEHFSRVFSARYGVGPAAFRAEHRFRRAFRAMLDGARPADAAAIAGYADQSHLTRECGRIAGLPPAALAREIKSVQDGDIVGG